MRLLLDTRVLLWWPADDAALASDHRRLIGDPRHTILVSAVTVAEVAIKVSLGELEIPGGILTAIEASGFDELPLSAAHADELRELPWHHRDPFDRMLIAQARVERVPFRTADARCREYDVETR